MTICVEIGTRIVELRRQKGFTQEGFALECGISISYLRRMEHGTANPTIEELEKIAGVLDVELINPIPMISAAIGAAS